MNNNNFIAGAGYLMDGFQLIFKPGLKRFVIIPLLINIIIFTGLFLLSRHFFGEFNHWFENFLPNWLKWLGTILWLLFFIGFVLFFMFFFVTIANIVAAPFNSFLSEKVEVYLTGKTANQLTLFETIKDVPRIMGRQIAILGYYLPRAVLLLILFFVPIIQVAAALLWFLFNAWFMTLQYTDYPTDNHRIAFSEVRVKLGQMRWLSLGFGMSVLVLTMIPVLNFLIIPAAVAGATKMWVEAEVT